MLTLSFSANYNFVMSSLLLYSALTHDEREIELAEADDGDKKEDDEDREEKIEWR
jgi:hypothetical protein